MQQEQPFNSFYVLVAQDMHLADPIISVDNYMLTIMRSKVWRYEWGLILADGQNMHIHILSDYRKKVFLRKPLREVAFFMFNKFETIYTQILKKPEVLAFDLAIGWKLTGESEMLYYLEMKLEDFRYA